MRIRDLAFVGLVILFLSIATDLVLYRVNNLGIPVGDSICQKNNAGCVIRLVDGTYKTDIELPSFLLALHEKVHMRGYGEFEAYFVSFLYVGLLAVFWAFVIFKVKG